MPDKDGYPTDEELETIKKWLIISEQPTKEDIFNNLLNLISYVESLWRTPDWGFELSKEEEYFELELHTGGYSGNELIMDALRANHIFWSMTWVETVRGGHYVFEYPMEVFNYKREISRLQKKLRQLKDLDKKGETNGNV